MKKTIIFIIILFTFVSILFSETQPEKTTNEYIIGKGDMLRLVWVTPKYPEQILTVNYEGFISSEILHRIKVEGLGLSEAKNLIKKQLSSRFVNLELDLTIVISRKIEETKFYNEFKSKMMLTEKYFLDMNYETTLFTLHEMMDLMLDKLKHIYPEKYGEKELFLQFRNVNFMIEGQAPFKLYNIEGEVVNHTQKSFQWVKCKIDFFNKDGRVVNSIERYIVSDEIIKPMDSKRFKFKGTLSPLVEDIDYKIIEFQITD
jgi:hypothetical protein